MEFVSVLVYGPTRVEVSEVEQSCSSSPDTCWLIIFRSSRGRSQRSYNGRAAGYNCSVSGRSQEDANLDGTREVQGTARTAAALWKAFKRRSSGQICGSRDWTIRSAVTEKAWKFSRPYHGPYHVLSVTPTNIETHLVDDPGADPIFVAVSRIRPCYSIVADTSWTGHKKARTKRAPISTQISSRSYSGPITLCSYPQQVCRNCHTAA